MQIMQKISLNSYTESYALSSGGSTAQLPLILFAQGFFINLKLNSSAANDKLTLN